MSLTDLNSPKKIDLDVEKMSLIDHLDSINSFSELTDPGNSREILLFRYPERRTAKL